MKEMTLTVALKKTFDLKHGQTLQDFKAEIDQLTPKDKDDFAVMFEQQGIKIVAPSA